MAIDCSKRFYRNDFWVYFISYLEGNMKVEIIDAYPLKNEKDEADIYSMHVYLPEIDLDLRGIMVKFVKKWVFLMPVKSNYDEDTKAVVQFPIASFANLKTNHAFRDNLSIAGTEYMQEKYAELQKKKRLATLRKKKKNES